MPDKNIERFYALGLTHADAIEICQKLENDPEALDRYLHMMELMYDDSKEYPKED